ncbi:unnamed protein product [Ixodes pacificus]
MLLIKTGGNNHIIQHHKRGHSKINKCFRGKEKYTRNTVVFGESAPATKLCRTRFSKLSGPRRSPSQNLAEFNIGHSKTTSLSPTRTSEDNKGIRCSKKTTFKPGRHTQDCRSFVVRSIHVF